MRQESANWSASRMAKLRLKTYGGNAQVKVQQLKARSKALGRNVSSHETRGEPIGRHASGFFLGELTLLSFPLRSQTNDKNDEFNKQRYSSTED
jgi:hypothetical protein